MDMCTYHLAGCTGARPAEVSVSDILPLRDELLMGDDAEIQRIK